MLKTIFVILLITMALLGVWLIRYAFKGGKTRLGRAAAVFCGLVMAIPLAAYLWLVPAEAMLASRALEVYNKSQPEPMEIARKSFQKDFKNGGTLVLVEYVQQPDRLHVYHYSGFGGVLTLENIRTSFGAEDQR